MNNKMIGTNFKGHKGTRTFPCCISLLILVDVHVNHVVLTVCRGIVSVDSKRSWSACDEKVALTEEYV